MLTSCRCISITAKSSADVRDKRSIFDLIENSTNVAFDNAYCRSLCGALPYDQLVDDADLEKARSIIDREFAFIGLTEYLQDSLNVMTRISGLPINEGQGRLNVTGMNTERLYLDILRYREAVRPRINTISRSTSTREQRAETPQAETPQIEKAEAAAIVLNSASPAEIRRLSR